MHAIKNLANIYKQGLAAKRKKHISLFRQLSEIIRLRSIGVGVSDYFQYRLYDDSIFKSFSEKQTYRGWRFKDELRHFSDTQIQGIAFHKHILYRLLASFDLPSPKIYDIYCAVADGFERHHSMTERSELKHYLKNSLNPPVFGKPSNASHGYGAIGIRDRQNDQFIMADGKSVAASDLEERIHNISLSTGSYLFTEYLQPADHFREICGSTLPSTRMVVLIRNGSPELYKCATLLPQDQRHVSNFQGGANKSLSAGIDPESGKLFHVMNSNFEYTERHPYSGMKIEGYQLPQWKEAKDLVLTAALAFSPFRMQHWDVAFSSRGPVILELNFIGDIEPLQMHGPPGIFTERFRSFYETHKVKKSHP